MSSRKRLSGPACSEPASNSKDTAPECVYLGRQPILDRNGALTAFELLFRSGVANFAHVTDDADATAHVIARVLGDVGIGAALGDHPGYVNVNRTMLMSDVVQLLPPERFVLEILEGVTFDPALFQRCAELRRAGFRLALDDVSQPSPRLLEALPAVDIVKVDFAQCPRAALGEMVDLVRQHGKVVLAEKVETREDYDAAVSAGFELFQGYYFAKPQVLASRRSTASREALLRLLALLSGEPDIATLEAELRCHPPLVIQLLRLLNSSAFGLPRTISSLREAIMTIGTRQITRWAQLLLFADGRQLALRSDPLAQLCGTRARFMELAAGRISPGGERFADSAFITGVLSLAHILFGGALEDIVRMLPLDIDIGQAILERRGELGLLLNAAEASESGNISAIRAACAAIPAMTSHDLAAMGLAAAAWYDGFAQAFGSGDATRS